MQDYLEQPVEYEEETRDQKANFDFVECAVEDDAVYIVGGSDEDVSDEQVYFSNEESDDHSDEENLHYYDEQAQNSVK